MKFRLIKNKSKSAPWICVSFPSKLQNLWKQRWFFCPSKLGRKKFIRNDIDFSSIEIMSKKVCQKNINFSLIEIALNKVQQKDVGFSITQITLNKVHRNGVNFSPIEITSKKYVEMTWKLVDILPLTWRHNIAIESMSIWRGVFFGLVLWLLLEKKCAYKEKDELQWVVVVSSH